MQSLHLRRVVVHMGAFAATSQRLVIKEFPGKLPVGPHATHVFTEEADAACGR